MAFNASSKGLRTWRRYRATFMLPWSASFRPITATPPFAPSPCPNSGISRRWPNGELVQRLIIEGRPPHWPRVAWPNSLQSSARMITSRSNFACVDGWGRTTRHSRSVLTQPLRRGLRDRHLPDGDDPQPFWCLLGFGRKTLDFPEDYSRVGSGLLALEWSVGPPLPG